MFEGVVFLHGLAVWDIKRVGIQVRRHGPVRRADRFRTLIWWCSTHVFAASTSSGGSSGFPG